MEGIGSKDTPTLTDVVIQEHTPRWTPDLFGFSANPEITRISQEDDPHDFVLILEEPELFTPASPPSLSSPHSPSPSRLQRFARSPLSIHSRVVHNSERKWGLPSLFCRVDPESETLAARISNYSNTIHKLSTDPFDPPKGVFSCIGDVILGAPVMGALDTVANASLLTSGLVVLSVTTVATAIISCCNLLCCRPVEKNTAYLETTSSVIRTNLPQIGLELIDATVRTTPIVGPWLSYTGKFALHSIKKCADSSSPPHCGN